MVSVQFRKKFKGPLFCGGLVKELETFTKHLVGISFQENVLPSFLLFSSVCYEGDLSGSERNELASSKARNFNNS